MKIEKKRILICFFQTKSKFYYVQRTMGLKSEWYIKKKMFQKHSLIIDFTCLSIYYETENAKLNNK